MHQLPEITNKDIQDVLKSWWKDKKLTKSPLLSLKIVQDKKEGSTELFKARAIKSVLRSLINELRPSDDFDQSADYDPADARWRAYHIIKHQYIECRQAKVLMDEIGFGENNYHHIRRQAIDTLLHALLDKEQEYYYTARLPNPEQLPEVHDFIGRQTDLAYYAKQLQDLHYVAITGAVGTGKTFLASKLLQKIAKPEQVFWHTAHTQKGIDDILWEMAAFLKENGKNELAELLYLHEHNGSSSLQARPDSVAHLLSGQGYTICFDNFQQVADKPQVQGLIESLYKQAKKNRLNLVVISQGTRPLCFSEVFDDLKEMDEEDAHRLVSQIYPEITKEYFTDLYAHTRGYPFFLQIAAQALKQNPTMGTMPDLLEGERAWLDEMSEGFSREQLDIMEAISILDDVGGSRELIEEILNHELNTRDVIKALSDLNRQGFLYKSVRAELQYYLHVIMKNYYYERLKTSTKRIWHRRAGDYYEMRTNRIQAAKHYSLAGDYEKVIRLLSDVWGTIHRGEAYPLLNLLQDVLNEQELSPHQWIEVQTSLGIVNTYLQNNTQAQKHFDDAIMELKIVDNTPEAREFRAKAYRGLGYVLRSESPKEALTWIQKGLEETSDDNLLARADLYIQLGFIYQTLGEPDQALEAIENTLDILPPTQEGRYLKMLALLNQGNIYFRRGEPVQADESYSLALHIAERIHSRTNQIQIQLNLAAIKRIQCQWREAIALCYDTITIANEIGYQKEIIRAKYFLGLIHFDQGQFSKAETNLLAVAEWSEENQATDLLISVQGYLAGLYLADNRTHELVAERIADAELRIKEHHFQFLQPFMSCLKAQLALAQKDYAQAIQSGQEAIALAQSYQMSEEEGDAHRIVGIAYHHMHDAVQAQLSFESSLTLLSDNSYKATLTQLCWGLACEDDMRTQEAIAVFGKIGATHNIHIVKGWLSKR
ncbi:MAG: AAA family ATPase [Chloroflexota bacterium]